MTQCHCISLSEVPAKTSLQVRLHLNEDEANYPPPGALKPVGLNLSDFLLSTVAELASNAERLSSLTIP